MEVTQKYLLTAVTESGAGSSVSVNQLRNYTIFYSSASVTTGATIVIQAQSLAGDWHQVDSKTVSADGLLITELPNKAYISIRANITSYTDGTHTVSFIGND